MAPRPPALRGLLLLVCGVAGCQAAPVRPPAPATKPPPTIRLCGRELPAEAAALRAEVLRHVAPGLPVEEARTRMQDLGFRCLYAGVLNKKPKSYLPTRSLPEVIGLCARDVRRDERFHSLVCTASANEVGEWGPRYFPLSVSLPYDEQGKVTRVEVAPLQPQPSPYAGFFARRPDLREPVGLPAEQARAVMEAHHFRCKNARPEGQAVTRRPYLDCYAYDEKLLGGHVVRVRLFYDPAGTVTEAEVIQRAGEFDDLRCMVPNDGDSLVAGLVKAAVLPVRLYLAIVVAGLAADLAMGRM